MDIKKKIEEIIGKLQSDKDLQGKFEKNPTGVVEELLGVDLPDDQINQVVETVKAKLAVGGIANALGGLFGKK